MAKKIDPESKAQADKPERRRNAPTRLSAEIPALTRTAFGKTLGGRGFAEAGLITEWASVVGAEIARMSQPIQLAFPRGGRNGGVVTVQCSGSAALELQHLKPQILERINTHFGYSAVAEIRLRQGSVAPTGSAPRRSPAMAESKPLSPTEKAALAADLSHLPEGEIKASLESFGVAMRRRHPTG